MVFKLLIFVLFIFNKRTESFHLACKDGLIGVVDLLVINPFKGFSINLNARHKNGKTPFNLTVHTLENWEKYMHGY